MTNAEYAVIEAALKIQLSGNWTGVGPCEYKAVVPPDDGHYVITPQGNAVQFTVLGQKFVRFNYPHQAESVAAILRKNGVFTRPSMPNHDRATVHASSHN